MIFGGDVTDSLAEKATLVQFRAQLPRLKMRTARNTSQLIHLEDVLCCVISTTAVQVEAAYSTGGVWSISPCECYCWSCDFDHCCPRLKRCAPFRAFRVLHPANDTFGLAILTIAVQVEAAYTTQDVSVLTALDKHHIWSDTRLKWRGQQPITVLLLPSRVCSLSHPVQLPQNDKYWGCFSWGVLQCF